MKYSVITCPICNKKVSSGGAAKTAHMRKHVRNGEAEETKVDGKIEFKASTPKHVDPGPYAKLGQSAAPSQPDGVFDIMDSLAELPAIDPKNYFITSGEAVKKAAKLASDLYSAAAKASSFKTRLEKSRAEAVYLETHWENGRLLVKRKSPRKKKC